MGQVYVTVTIISRYVFGDDGDGDGIDFPASHTPHTYPGLTNAGVHLSRKTPKVNSSSLHSSSKENSQ